MGKILNKVDKGEAFLTSRTILFKPGHKNTYTDGLSSIPYIGGETNTKRITDTQEYSSKAEDEGKIQYTREIRLDVQLPLCKLNCEFHIHNESTTNMKVDKYVLCGQICG